LAIDPQQLSNVYAGGCCGGVFRSRNSADTWTLPIYEELVVHKVFALVVDPLSPSTLYAATQAQIQGVPGRIHAIFRSSDSGDTWVRADSGLSNSRVRSLAIDPATPSILYAGTYRGVFRTRDSGETWEAANVGLPEEGWVKAIAIDPANPSTIYAGGLSGVSCSRDSGDSWETLTNEFPDLSINALAIDPENPSTLYAGTSDAGVFRSTDSGETWEPMNSGLNNLDV
jgi:photosystem II stability/assembly factor-like uncharacterized protein